MIEQEKLDKAFRVLEGYKYYSLRHNNESLKVTDIIALLKAHCPRVMTLEEIEAEKPIAKVIYVEGCESNGETELFYGVWVKGRYMMSDGSVLFDADLKPGGILVKSYGHEIRRWSSCPTDEQRKAVKWDE